MSTEVPKPLPFDQLRQRCDPKELELVTSGPTRNSELVGQDRGLNALRFAVEIRHYDFNLYVLGPQGTGRRTAIKSILNEYASARGPSNDWAYVNNFDDPHKPVALRLPSGTGEALKTEMARVVDDLANDIPALFESEEYQTQRRAIDEEFGELQEKAMADFASRARVEDIALIRTPMGFMVAATRDGEVVKTEDFNKLP